MGLCPSPCQAQRVNGKGYPGRSIIRRSLETWPTPSSGSGPLAANAPNLHTSTYIRTLQRYLLRIPAGLTLRPLVDQVVGGDPGIMVFISTLENTQGESARRRL